MGVGLSGPAPRLLLFSPKTGQGPGPTPGHRGGGVLSMGLSGLCGQGWSPEDLSGQLPSAPLVSGDGKGSFSLS